MESINAIKIFLRDATYYLCMQLLLKSIGILLKNFKPLTCQNFRQVQKEGNRSVTREIPFYNLDMIISLGYRIKSKIVTNFRKWATERLY